MTTYKASVAALAQQLHNASVSITNYCGIGAPSDHAQMELSSELMRRAADLLEAQPTAPELDDAALREILAEEILKTPQGATYAVLSSHEAFEYAAIAALRRVIASARPVEDVSDMEGFHDEIRSGVLAAAIAIRGGKIAEAHDILAKAASRASLQGEYHIVPDEQDGYGVWSWKIEKRDVLEPKPVEAVGAVTEITDEMVEAAYAGERSATIPDLVSHPSHYYASTPNSVSFMGTDYPTVNEAKDAQNKFRLRAALEAALQHLPSKENILGNHRETVDMVSKFQRMWEDAEERIRIYERVTDRASDKEILRAALRVINRHNLSQEFVDELGKTDQ